MEKNKGIILKSYQPYTCKVVILDADFGKITAVPHRENMSNGLCVSYYLQEQPNIYFMRDIEIIDMPMALGKEDILFVHHILELCYYFIPMGGCAPGIFPLLVKMYDSPHIFQSTLLKKIFLFQCFTVLGLYPEGRRFQDPLFLYLSTASIDNLADQSVDLVNERELDTWLLHCISVHPCIEHFKTINFLHTHRVV